MLWVSGGTVLGVRFIPDRLPFLNHKKTLWWKRKGEEVANIWLDQGRKLSPRKGTRKLCSNRSCVGSTAGPVLQKPVSSSIVGPEQGTLIWSLVSSLLSIPLFGITSTPLNSCSDSLPGLSSHD